MNQVNGFSCECADTGFTGATCSEDMDECTEGSHACRNGGQCVNVPGSYVCSCFPNYSGRLR